MEKEFEMMLQKRLEDSEKKMLKSAACTPFTILFGQYFCHCH